MHIEKLKYQFVQMLVQFSVDRTLAGSEAHKFFNQRKLDYASNFNRNKRLAGDEGTVNARSYKYRRGQRNEGTPGNKVSIFHHVLSQQNAFSSFRMYA